MDHVRRVRIASAIADAARVEGAPIRLRHVCRAARVVVGVAGVSLSVVGDLGFGETVCATDATSEHSAELEVILGVGPAVDALALGDPVLVDDVSQPTPDRWPRLDAVLAPMGVVALFAFPLTVADQPVGVLELYRTRPGALSGFEVADAETFAQAAAELLVNIATGERADEPSLGPLDAQWLRINHAVGEVSAQLDSTAAEAYLRIRMYAFLSGRRLRHVAEDVLAGDLRFAPDPR